MAAILNLVTKNIHIEEDLFPKLSISKKSKTIDRRVNIIEVKNKNTQQSDIWNIDSILSKIFEYTDHRDLIKLNTVCKKWNYLSNPIIHKTIKLYRNWDIIERSNDKRLSVRGKIEEDVVKCISNNTKHAHLIKDFHYSYKLEARRIIEVFGTFRFISKLAIEDCEMNQDQFLGMVSPLTQLQELILENLRIKNITCKGLYKEAVQLPSSLKKLGIYNSSITNNPKLFIKTINSHTNLVEFSFIKCDGFDPLKPFYKPYPSLINFEYENRQLQSPQSLIKVFEQNFQLVSLKLSLCCWSSELTSNISRYLINLEEFNFYEYELYSQDYTDIFLKFSQPTKIKKLSLRWIRISNCSLDSILHNCPQLEELNLNRFYNYQKRNSEIPINFSKTAKIKKLTINCQYLSRNIFDTILLNYFHLNELVIVLPTEWKKVMKSIYEKCTNLQKLDIYPCNNLLRPGRDTFLKEFYESELFIGNFRIQSTLTQLTLSEFLAIDSKAGQFSNFQNLKSIKYINQSYRKYGQSNIINMDLWPGYKQFPIHIDEYSEEIELKKINN
jgi:hypothetical protein